MTKKEYRTMEIRAANEGDELIVEGYAIVYNQRTTIFEVDGIKYYEIIAPGALDNADLRDVPFKYNHSNNMMIMARTRNKTLQLMPDNKGLFIRANLINNTQGNDLYKLIKRGDIDKMSFAFTVDKEEYDRETRTRKILSFKKIWDVSAVSEPAYDGTSISARDYFLAQEEMFKKEKNQELRKKLILRTYL